MHRQLCCSLKKVVQLITYVTTNPMSSETWLKQTHLMNEIQPNLSILQSRNRWLVSVEDIYKDTLELTLNNPNSVEEVDNITPEEIIAEIEALNAQVAKTLSSVIFRTQQEYQIDVRGQYRTIKSYRKQARSVDLRPSVHDEEA